MLLDGFIDFIELLPGICKCLTKCRNTSFRSGILLQLF